MPKKIKLSRKQIKKPDDFLTFSEKVWEWGRQNIWFIGGIVFVILIGVFVIRMASSWYELSQDEPRRALAQAEQVFNASVNEDQDELSRAMMGRRGGKPQFDTNQQKYQQAIESFNKVINAYPETTEAQLAYLYLAVSHEKMQRYEEALNYYDKFLETKPAQKNEALNDAAIMGKARIKYESKNYRKSLSYLKKLEKSDSSYKNDARLMMARCYHHMGDEDKAQKTIETIRQRSETSKIAKTAPYLQTYWKKKQEGIITIPEETSETGFMPAPEEAQEKEEVKEAAEILSSPDRKGKDIAGEEQKTTEEKRVGQKEKQDKKSGAMIKLPADKVEEESAGEGGLRLPAEGFDDTEGSSEERLPLFPEE